MRTISVIGATYIDGFKLNIYFNDGTSQVVDFSKFLNKHDHPQYNKYKNEKKFQTFKSLFKFYDFILISWLKPHFISHFTTPVLRLGLKTNQKYGL